MHFLLLCPLFCYPCGTWIQSGLFLVSLLGYVIEKWVLIGGLQFIVVDLVSCALSV